MKKALIASIVALVALSGAGTAALYAYDGSRTDVIARGVRAAGVDVGEMTAAQARVALGREVAAPLARPLIIEHRGRGWILRPNAAHVRVDVDGMVEAALEESRRGNFLTRSFRELTGRSVHARIPLRVTQSRRVVARLAAGIGRVVDRRPRNADADVSLTAIRLTPSRDGVKVRVRELQGVIASHLSQPGAPRRVRVPVAVLKPKVTTAELRSKYRYLITISRPQFRLRLFVGLKLAKTYRISVGRAGYDTPAGLYRIRNKAANPAWYVPDKPWAGRLAGRIVPPGPKNPIKARWMGIYNEAGIHGTDAVKSIGRRASHGCIRMTIPDVVDLYDRVPVGTPVYIA